MILPPIRAQRKRFNFIHNLKLLLLSQKTFMFLIDTHHTSFSQLIFTRRQPAYALLQPTLWVVKSFSEIFIRSFSALAELIFKFDVSCL